MLLRSLSARLLVLTIFFVMVSEVMIFVPSIARFRMTYFENRLAAGHIATAALKLMPPGSLNQGSGTSSWLRSVRLASPPIAATARFCGSTAVAHRNPISRST